MLTHIENVCFYLSCQTIMYPGIFEYSLCVGSVASTSIDFIKNNTYIDCFSAGNNICSLRNNEDNKNIYSIKSGTSMATPQMSGIIALIIDGIYKKFFPNLNSNDVPIKEITMLVHDYILFNEKFYNNYLNCGRGIILLDIIINKLLQYDSYNDFKQYLIN